MYGGCLLCPLYPPLHYISNWCAATHFDSEDDYRTGCRNVHVNNNSAIQDFVHPDDQTQPSYEMTPGFKPFTEELYVSKTVKENALASEANHADQKQ